MKLPLITPTLSLLFILMTLSACNGPQVKSPSTKGGLETDQYRNVFVEAGYSPAEVDAKVQEVFNDVFRGPNKAYFEVGDSMGYVSDIKNNDVRTEGMSYGMMIAVQFGEKDIFDRLWRWSQRYMQHQDGPREGYFAWSCRTDGTPNSFGSASDGELYYITALLFASNRWGNNTGIDYKAEAQRIINCSMSKTGEGGAMPLLHPEHKLITFTPDQRGMRFTDPSYHLPAFYEVWARWADDGRADYWMECARLSREYLHKTTHPTTGLSPDYSHYDGSPMDSRGWMRGSQNFRYDSWRVPMNIALDYSWSCADREWQQQYGQKIQQFFYAQGVNDFVDQYRIDGTLPSDEEILRAGRAEKALRHSIGLVGAVASTALLHADEHTREFVDALWNAKHEPFPDGYFDAYYDGLLRLFAFMHLSGKYQVIVPQ